MSGLRERIEARCSREGKDLWDAFRGESQADVSEALESALRQSAAGPSSSSFRDRSAATVFVARCFRAIEVPSVRNAALPLAALPLWASLSPAAAARALKGAPTSLRRQLVSAQRRFAPDAAPRALLPALLRAFLAEAEAAGSGVGGDGDAARFFAWSLALLAELLLQFPTRRFFHAVFADSHAIARLRVAWNCCGSGGVGAKEASATAIVQQRRVRLFALLEQLSCADAAAVEDLTGATLTRTEAEQAHCARVQALQRTALRLYPEKLRALALANIGSIARRDALSVHLEALNDSELRALAVHVGLMDPERDATLPLAVVLEELLLYHERRPASSDAALAEPLLPTEKTLWSDAVANGGEEEEFGGWPLALARVNMQFLSLEDYLARHATLYNAEVSAGVRDDIDQAVRRYTQQGSARMALPAKETRVVRVGQPSLGSVRPSEAVCELRVSLDSCAQPRWREEWDELRQHDVLFLASLAGEDGSIKTLRGCEVIEVADERGVAMRDEDAGKARSGSTRIFRVLLDTTQFAADLSVAGDSLEKLNASIYSEMNVVIRRRKEENSFKAVLDAMRTALAHPESVNIPDWLSDMLLGYGPSQQGGDEGEDEMEDEAEGSSVEIDFRDTFTSEEHLLASFPGHKVTVHSSAPGCYYRIRGLGTKEIEAMGYIPVSMAGLRNAVRFTPEQVSAIRSAISAKDGLTLISGCVGSGKTDIAVQIIASLYRTFPSQRILVITRSNDALNQIFDKLVRLDIDERHCLRLGHGEQRLDAKQSEGKDFTRRGRINYALQRRMVLLGSVETLARSLGLSLDASSSAAATCENAGYFLTAHVVPRWTRFRNASAGKEPFPFAEFFGSEASLDADAAEFRWKQLCAIFDEIEELRAFELLRSNADRATFLLSRQARIVAMTCAHAALKRKDLEALDFCADTIVMEEASQVLEAEALVPLLLSRHGDKVRELRLVLIGDHLQLGPVVRNSALRKHEAGLAQSMFNRFVRAGASVHVLGAQGRCRPSLVPLFSWRYPAVENLPNVLSEDVFTRANAGLAHECQVVDVGDLYGHGETCPAPHVHQNRAEAEYVVRTYMYLRLLGWPADRIAILSAYRGQDELIHAIVRHRCSSTPEDRVLLGEPRMISTVDAFQGRQADIVLLSFVRTKRLTGHICDPRRLVVAFSRARLGLYIFCRKSLLLGGIAAACPELAPALQLLRERPDTLQLVENEPWPTQRPITQDDAQRPKPFTVKDLNHMAHIVDTALATRKHELQQQQRQQQHSAAAMAIPSAAPPPKNEDDEMPDA